MSPPEKPRPGNPATEAEIDAFYGLEPVIDAGSSGMDPAAGPDFVVVHCPYCGEAFEASVDPSVGMCSYVEDCQICCQPIEMELRVDDAGRFRELVTRRGDG